MSDTRRRMDWSNDAVAYDYEAQRWIVGEEAKALLASQEAEERALLDGPRGDEYRAFVRKVAR